jgi:L-methionine (R)-S-oxide reductase
MDLFKLRLFLPIDESWAPRGILSVILRRSNVDGDQICRELSRFAADCAEFDQMLKEAVRILHKSNRQFHWTGIYELFPDGMLRLGPFIGAATDHVFISVGQGVCGSAVAEKRNKNIPDVTKEPNYLACSSATKSELVVLIQKNEKIFAQIDIDSHDMGAFDEQTVEAVQKVADWLANAYEARAGLVEEGR